MRCNPDYYPPNAVSLFHLGFLQTNLPFYAKRKYTCQDVVSDGGIQEKVLGAAQRTENGFFTAPRVVEK